MIITQIEVWNFRPLMRDGPYAMSHVTQDSAYGRILQVHTDDGLKGLGEVVFPPSVPQAAQMGQIAEERAFLPALIGVGGWLQSRSMVERAVAAASPEVAAQLRAAGNEMALAPLYFGTGSWMLAGMVAIPMVMLALSPAGPRPGE